MQDETTMERGEEIKVPQWAQAEEKRAAKRAAKAKPAVQSYEERRAAGMLSYEELCDHSRAHVSDMDTRRWDVGDDACAMETKYGEATLASMARDVNMNKTTLASWKRVADYYPEIIRRRLLDNLENLSYSHYKDALRLKDIQKSVAWLEKCSEEGWSPDQASHKLTELLHGPDEGDDGDSGDEDDTRDIPGTITNVFKRDGSCIVEMTIGLDDMALIASGARVTLKFKD